MSTGSTLKSFFIKLGLETDVASFAAGMTAVNAFEAGLKKVAELAIAATKFFIDFNAEAEGIKLQLATVIGLDMKKPWAEAKVAADDFFQGLQKEAARTPATTQELATMASQIAEPFLKAGKSLDELREFTAGVTVVAKMTKMENLAPVEIQEAIKGQIRGPQRFSRFLVESGLGMSREEFLAKDMKTRADLLMKSVTSPTIQAARKEYENNWAGLTSTIKDNLQIIGGQMGKPLFEDLEKWLKRVSDWITENKDNLLAIGKPFVEVLRQIAKFLEGAWRVGKAFFGLLIGAFKWLNDVGGPVIGKLNVALGALIVAMVIFGAEATAAALKTAAAWTLANLPVMALLAGLALLYLIIEDVIVGLEGGRSLIFEIFGTWKQFLDEWSRPNEGDWWLLAQIKAAVHELLHLQALLGNVETGFSFDAVDTAAGRAAGFLGFRGDPNAISAYSRALAAENGAAGGVFTSGPYAGLPYNSDLITGKGGLPAAGVLGKYDITNNISVVVPAGSDADDVGKAVAKHVGTMLQDAQSGVFF